ncbi:MAG TPA: hypothetical protein VGP47_00005 [Parachlamydiaceae bacterium]|nr:hypothetical protein [Parachlamydiaceae bacterium]
MLVNSFVPTYNTRDRLIDIFHEENEIHLVDRLDSILQENYYWNITESHIPQALCNKVYKIITKNNLHNRIGFSFSGSFQYQNIEFCEYLYIQKKINKSELYNFPPIANQKPMTNQEINIDEITITEEEFYSDAISVTEEEIYSDEEKENFNINKIEKLGFKSLDKTISDRTSSLKHLHLSKKNAANSDLSKVQILENHANYALYDSGKMFALILRNVIPKEITNNFKATKISTQPWPRGEAGVFWDTYEADHVNIFNELQGEDLEKCLPGAYIFPSANKYFGKNKQKYIEHVVYFLSAKDKKLTTFRVVKADKAWDSTEIVLSDEQNKILMKVPDKQSGSFTYEKNRIYFQKILNKTIIAEIIGTEKATTCQKSVQSTSYGSKACKNKKSFLLSTKVRKIDQEGATNDQVCKPYDFKNDERIQEILETTNYIVKTLIVQNTDNHLDELLNSHATNARKLKAWCGPDGFFSNIHVNFTSLDKPTTNFHKDKNVEEDGLAALLVTGNQYTGGETVFPELFLDGKPMGADMREGDLMLFKSKKYLHGNLPVKQLFDYKKNKDCVNHPENRRSIVLYLNDSFNQCQHQESFAKKTLKSINSSELENKPALKKRKLDA